MTKKHTNKLLKWEEIMIARQIIYWIATMFFTIEKSEETTSEFKQNAATDHGEGKKIVQPLNLKPKSLNQIFVIIQTHIFL